MQVMPFWTRLIGDGDPASLFHMQTNLRFGCVILRHYLDRENGDLFLALGRYNGSRGRPNIRTRCSRRAPRSGQSSQPTHAAGRLQRDRPGLRVCGFDAEHAATRSGDFATSSIVAAGDRTPAGRKDDRTHLVTRVMLRRCATAEGVPSRTISTSLLDDPSSTSGRASSRSSAWMLLRSPPAIAEHGAISARRISRRTDRRQSSASSPMLSSKRRSQPCSARIDGRGCARWSGLLVRGRLDLEHVHAIEDRLGECSARRSPS